MSKLDQQFREDRALRNSALAMFKADIEHVKTGLSGKSLAERTVSRVMAGAKDALETTGEKAGDSKGVLAVVVAAIAVWFAREPIMEAFNNELDAKSEADTKAGIENGEDDAETLDDLAVQNTHDIVLTPPDDVPHDANTPGDDDD